MMAVGTLTNLKVMLAFFEMADKACAVCNSDVFTLDNLGMAAGALELLAPF